MAIDYEVEYNNRARVPEHPADLRALAARRRRLSRRGDEGRPRRARPEVRPVAAPDHRPVQARSGGKHRPARAVHSRRLLALAGAFELQPDGARHERARRHRRGVGLRSCAAGFDRRDHRADAAGLPVSVEALQQAHHGERPFRRRPSRRLHGRDRLEGARRRARRPISCRSAMRSPGCSISSRCCISPSTPTSSSTRPRRAASRRCSGRWRRAACSTPWSAATKSLGIPAAEQDHRRRLGRAGVETRYEAMPGTNHFTVCDPMTDPDSAMTKRLVELAKRQRSEPVAPGEHRGQRRADQRRPPRA